MEGVGLEQCRPDQAAAPRKGPVHPRLQLAPRGAQAQTAQALNVEEHSRSLDECETGFNKERANDRGRNPKAANFWQPIHSQRKRHPARSEWQERRECLRSRGMLKDQGHLESRKTLLERTFRTGHEPTRGEHKALGNHHGKHTLAPRPLRRDWRPKMPARTRRAGRTKSPRGPRKVWKPKAPRGPRRPRSDWRPRMPSRSRRTGRTKSPRGPRKVWKPKALRGTRRTRKPTKHSQTGKHERPGRRHPSGGLDRQPNFYH